MMTLSRVSRFAAVLAPLLLHAQGLSVSPKTLKLMQPEGGPIPLAAIEITSVAPQPWTASAATGNPEDPWIELRAASGTTPARLMVGVVPWRAGERKPGKYSGKITIHAGSAAETVQVEWEVRPSLPPPPISAVKGPEGCVKVDGYPDPPHCKVMPLAGVLGAPATGASYTDPNFGGHVRVLTGPKTNHPYSTPTPLSAHNTYIITTEENGAFSILDTATGKVAARRLQCSNGCFWDAADDGVYYSIEKAAILRHEVRGDKTSLLIDYAKQPEPLHEIKRGGTGDTSKDNWVTFWAPDEKQLCALDIGHVKTYCADYGASERRLKYGDVDFTLITKGIDKQSGKRYVMLIAPPAMGVFSVDMDRGILKPEFRGPENLERDGNKDGKCDPGERCMVGSHLDTLEDEAGIQYLVEDQESSSPCEVALNTLQLNKGIDMTRRVEIGGGRRRVLTLWRCGPGWVDEHIGCAKSSPYCVISTQSPQRRQGDLAEVKLTPHAGEIIVMRGNGEEIKRIAISRTVFYSGAGDANYWAAPRAAISNDGSLVVADMNFGDPAGHRVTVIETGASKPSR